MILVVNVRKEEGVGEGATEQTGGCELQSSKKSEASVSRSERGGRHLLEQRATMAGAFNDRQQEAKRLARGLDWR